MQFVRANGLAQAIGILGVSDPDALGRETLALPLHRFADSANIENSFMLSLDTALSCLLGIGETQ